MPHKEEDFKFPVWVTVLIKKYFFYEAGSYPTEETAELFLHEFLTTAIRMEYGIKDFI